jgi:hypothetical protein
MICNLLFLFPLSNENVWNRINGSRIKLFIPCCTRIQIWRQFSDSLSQLQECYVARTLMSWVIRFIIDYELVLCAPTGLNSHK